MGGEFISNVDQNVNRTNWNMVSLEVKSYIEVEIYFLGNIGGTDIKAQGPHFGVNGIP